MNKKWLIEEYEQHGGILQTCRHPQRYKTRWGAWLAAVFVIHRYCSSFHVLHEDRLGKWSQP